MVSRVQVATAGLFVAWMVNDLEELATMSANSRALARRLPDWVPAPASVRRTGLTQRYVAKAAQCSACARARCRIPRRRPSRRLPRHQE